MYKLKAIYWTLLSIDLIFFPPSDTSTSNSASLKYVFPLFDSLPWVLDSCSLLNAFLLLVLCCSTCINYGVFHINWKWWCVICIGHVNKYEHVGDYVPSAKADSSFALKYHGSFWCYMIVSWTKSSFSHMGA